MLFHKQNDQKSSNFYKADGFKIARICDFQKAQFFWICACALDTKYANFQQKILSSPILLCKLESDPNKKYSEYCVRGP